MGDTAVFKKGDRVAWHHTYASQFAPGTVIRAEHVISKSLPPDHPLFGEPGSGQFGTVTEGDGFLWDVLLDGTEEPRTLTADELVRIEEPAVAA